MRNKKAFTLAEVLITLTIIGVIAAITIPNLMQKWEDNAQVSGLKTAYSLLNNALNLAIRENGPLSDWQWPSSASYNKDNKSYFVDEFLKYIKGSKLCPTSYNGRGACSLKPFGINIINFSPTEAYGFYKGLNGQKSDFTANTDQAIMLNNNMILYIYIGYPSNLFDSWILVDTNGPKGPNRQGYDLFHLQLGVDGLVSRKIVRECDRTSLNEYSCAYWVMKHGNMDYKYRDVSAEW